MKPQEHIERLHRTIDNITSLGLATGQTMYALDTLNQLTLQLENLIAHIELAKEEL